MAVTRANVEATKAFIRARIGNPYVYGGALSASNVRQGTDCSEVWQTVLEMALGRYVQGRQSEGATTESYRYIPVGGVGPFGTIRVAHWRDIPSNAVARIAFHHGPGGGANSHMWGDFDGMRIESRGGRGLVTGNDARAPEDSYATAWAYLPGPIIETGQKDPVDILARATGVSYDRATNLLPSVRDGLIQAECTNPNRIAMWLAQVGHESDDFRATAEYASGDAYDTRTDLGNTPERDGDGRLYKGRTWIMITGKANYRKFSEWAFKKGLVNSPTYFVDHPLELSELKWAGIGAAWYWTVERPDINALSDKRDIETVTRRINGGLTNLADRKRRYNLALPLGDELLALINAGDELTPEQDKMLREVHACLFNKNESWSDLATPGEGKIWMLHEKIHSIDGMLHPIHAERRARAGDLNELHRIVLAAKGQGKVTDEVTKRVYQNIIADIERTNPEVLERYIEERGTL
ncbi:lysin A [Mycobacterium phage Gilberta]|nr:lysin A [Mycobacterium phage Gilberta]UXE05056.1 lysin A [Mycobacterium phage MaCh]